MTRVLPTYRRRLFQRLAVTLPTKVAWPSPEGPRAAARVSDGMIVNISGSGVRLRLWDATADDLHAGAHLGLGFEVAGYLFRVLSAVTWVQADDGAGLLVGARFEHMTEFQRDRITRYVLERVH